LSDCHLRGKTVEKSLDEKIVLQQAAPATPTQLAQSALTQRGVAIQSFEQFISHFDRLFV
jgi:hypothetical protein